MLKSKRLIAALAVLLVASFLYAGGSKEAPATPKAGSAPEIQAMVLKLGHIAEPSHPYAKGGDYFADLVKKKSGGKIEIKTYHSSQLGDQKSLIEGLIYGTVDMALVGTAALGQFQPQISLFDLPFLFEDLDHAYKSLDSVGMDLGKALEPKGIKLLGYMENGIRHMTNNVREIKTPADMKGLKIRVQTNKIFVSMMKALGASPTPMSLGELYTAMQQGRRRRAGEPGGPYLHPEVLRSAEVRLAHGPRLRSGTRPRLHDEVERLSGKRAPDFHRRHQGGRRLAAQALRRRRLGVLGQGQGHGKDEGDRGRQEALHGSDGQGS